MIEVLIAFLAALAHIFVMGAVQVRDSWRSLSAVWRQPAVPGSHMSKLKIAGHVAMLALALTMALASASYLLSFFGLLRY